MPHTEKLEALATLDVFACEPARPTTASGEFGDDAEGAEWSEETESQGDEWSSGGVTIEAGEGAEETESEDDSRRWSNCVVIVHAHFAGLTGEARADNSSFKDQAAFERSTDYALLRMAALIHLREKIEEQKAQLALYSDLN